MPAKIVNDNAGNLQKRSQFAFFAGKPAPTKSRGSSDSVGAGLPAKIVNDNAGNLPKRSQFAFFAGKPAPTKSRGSSDPVGAGLPAKIVNDDAECQVSYFTAAWPTSTRRSSLVSRRIRGEAIKVLMMAMITSMVKYSLGNTPRS